MSISNLDNHPKRVNERIQDDAELQAMIKQHGAAGVEAIKRITEDLGRLKALCEPVSKALPGIQVRHCPGVLLCLGRVQESAEAAALLVAMRFAEEGITPTPAQLDERVGEVINEHLLDLYAASEHGGLE